MQAAIPEESQYREEGHHLWKVVPL